MMMQCLAITGLCLAFQAEGAGKTEQKEASPWPEYFTSTVKEYEIQRMDADKHKLVLEPKPIFRWSNPVRGPVHDALLFVWLYQGRPAAIGNIFALHGRDEWQIWHEFHSLDLVPLHATWRGQLLWSPPKAAVEFKPVPDAPAPADSAEERTRQMRSLARDFTANSIDEKDAPWELRLLPQTIYRYGTADSDVLDGGLFIFVQATDPELILLVEARRKDETYQWYYACARFTDYRLQLRYKGTEVWAVAPGRYRDVTAPHFHFYAERLNSPPAADKKPEQTGSRETK